MSNRLKTLRERATRPRRTVSLQLDGEVREQIEAVEDELDRLYSIPAESGNDRRMSSKPKAADPRIAELEADLDRLFESSMESTLHVVLEGLQRSPYRALIAKHPARTDGDGKMRLEDLRLGGVNAESVAIPLAKACIVGYRERPEVDAPVLSFPPDLVDGQPNEQELTVGWLLGYSHTTEDMAADGGVRTVEVEGFATPRQVSLLANVAIELCGGDDAVPLRRQRSTTTTSDAG